MNKLILLLVLLLTACATESSREYTGNESNTRERARVHTELGAGYYAQKQMNVALDEFTEAVRIDPTYGLAYNGLGLVYAALKEDAKADTNFKKSLQLDASNSESHNNYGTFLCSRDRVDESITQFMAAISNPLYLTPGIAYLNAGLCSLRKSDKNSAEIYFQKAIKAQPLLSQAGYQLAVINFDRGQYQAAHDYLQKALSTDPSPDALWLGIRVERIRGDKDAVASYALLLRNKYPDSEQTKALLSGQ